ncbi:unnamed protein product [Caenorhabditis nigoni]
MVILAIGSATGQAVIPTIQSPVNPCDTFQCAPGTKCKLQDSLCRTGPCYVPTCVPDTKCQGVNQEWSDCGAACPKRCEQKEPVMCPAICRPGCVCKKGFCLRTSGDCVAEN